MSEKKIVAIQGDGIESLKEVLGEMFASASKPEIVPATREQVLALIEPREKMKIGDVVRLRPHAENRYKFPKAGQECIVTQVKDVPVHEGREGTAGFAVPNDIAIALFDTSDNMLLEFLHDSRNFEVVGNILN
jgi:hypothetical protein